MRDLFERGRELLQLRGGKQRLVAFALQRRVLRAVAFNSYCKTHPVQADFARRTGCDQRQFLHAEIAALLKCPEADELVVVRTNKRGELVNAKPCPVCQEAIRLSRVKIVRHS